MKFRRTKTVVGLLLAVFLVSCSQEPAEIHYGDDECAHCRMMISDARFASQIVTSKGKALKFDAIECMAAYVTEHREELNEARLWVSNFSSPGNWVDAESAYFVKSEEIQSPMGESLLAFGSLEQRNQHLGNYSGRELNWNELMK